MLIWYEIFSRPELLKPFIDLSDTFEFVHLYYNSPKEKKVDISPFETIYWFDYPTPYQLLKKIKPDLIFSEFPSDLKSIALNIAAKNMGIPYLAMTHGIFFEDSFDIKINNGNSLFKTNRYSAYFKILHFYLSSIKFRNLKNIVSILRFLFYFIKDGYFAALSKVKSKLRWPDRYIVYQLKNSVEIISNTHNYPYQKIIPIGVPQFDEMIQYWNARNGKPETDNYYLMIDTAWIYNVNMPSPELIRNTYLKLAEFCRRKGCKLYVKIHPYWYDKTDLPCNDNIEYVRNISQKDLAEIILRAKGCFLYFSTLSIPIIPYKDCYFLYYKKRTKDVEDITVLGVAKSIDIADMNIEDIDFNSGNTKKFMYKYIQDYLYSIDGHATERLKEIMFLQSFPTK